MKILYPAKSCKMLHVLAKTNGFKGKIIESDNI
jgi:hypothetical protein